MLKHTVKILYQIQLQCMHQCNGLWQHIQNSVDSQINDFMDKTYLKLNKKLDSLTKQTHNTHNIERKAHTFHSRVINLTNVNFTREQINTLALGAIMRYFNCIF